MQFEEPDETQFLKEKILSHISQQHYQQQLEDIQVQESSIFTIDLDFLWQKDIKLFDMLLNQPMQIITLFEQSLKEFFIRQTAQEINTTQRLRISFKGNLGLNTVTPRGLKSNLINKLVLLKGNVNYCSKAQTRIQKSVHFCEKTNQFQIKNYFDNLKLRDFKAQENVQNNQVPIQDPRGNFLSFEHGLSEFNDFQILGVQENTENVPTGMLSWSVDVYLQEDMVDKAKPGDKIVAIGILWPKQHPGTGATGNFEKYFMAYSIESLTKVHGDSVFLADEIENFKKVSQKTDLLDLFIWSLAPSIYGHRLVKEGLLLQMLGGREVQLENEGRIRGDINILLIGDPGTGKSQFLRKIKELVPLCINSTGWGASGVGLTAAIIHDKETNEKKLEAGAMVLADRGVICLDEFDKMNFEDRVVMHEVMEQQTVTIAKAGIHISLNARCSVLAAANPIYGEYVTKLSPSQNIGIQETLLTRFDLIFIVIDSSSEIVDRNIAEKVGQNHRFNSESGNAFESKMTTGKVEMEIIQNDSNENYDVYQQYNPLLHDSRNKQYLTTSFLKKYIEYARATVEPVMKPEAGQLITEKWSEIWRKEKENQRLTKILPVSIRSLESIIRLSYAYAKLRLSWTVEIRDVINSLFIYLEAFYGGYESLCPRFFEGYEEYIKNLQSKMNVQWIAETQQTTIKVEEKQSESWSWIKVDEDLQNSQQRISTIKNNPKMQRCVFNVLYILQNERGGQITKQMILDYLNSKERKDQFSDVKIESKEILDSVLQELEEKNKVIIDKENVILI